MPQRSTARGAIPLRAALVLLLIGGAPRDAAGAPGIERDVGLLSHASLKRRMDARGRVLQAGKKAVPALLAAMHGDPRDAYKRHAAIYLLGEIGDPSASESLLQFARDEGQSIRQRFWALSSLAKLKEERAVPLAVSYLASDSDALRRASMWLILSRPSEVSVPILLDALRSERLPVRSMAVDGLRRLSGERRGFDAGGEASAREEAVKRWEAWWEEHKAFPPKPPGPVEQEEYRLDGCTVWTDGGEARAKEIGAKVKILREAFPAWFGTKRRGMETRVREFRRWEDFRRYGSLNQWGFQIVSEFFYSPFLHEVVTYDTGHPATNDRGLIHEVFHDFYHRNTDTQLPWFNEGMAEFFETWKFEDGELRPGPRNNEWPGMARTALAAAPEGYLPTLMTSTQEEFYFQGRAGKYAVSWALVDFLLRRDDGRKDLRRVFGLLKKSWARDRIQRRVFGKKKIASLEREFRKSLSEEP